MHSDSIKEKPHSENRHSDENDYEDSYHGKLKIEPYDFEAAKYYNKSVRNQRKSGPKYYLLSADSTQVYGIFKTIKECKIALMRAGWDESYMMMPRHIETSDDEENSYFAGTETGIVMYGSAKIMANNQVCDGPPQMEMDWSDYQLCLEKKHPRLEYVGTFKSTENGCIKI